MKKLIFKYPIISSIIISILAVGVTFIPLNLIMPTGMDGQLKDYLSGIIDQTLAGIFLLIGIKKLGLYDKAGFSLKVKDIWITWPIVLLIILFASDIVTGDVVIDTARPGLIIAFLLTYLSTGFVEEILFRGMVFLLVSSKWQGKKCVSAIMISSVFFGSTHFIHYFLGRSSFTAAIYQVVYTTFIGVFFAACVVRNKSIYPAIILHALINISTGLKEIAVGGGIHKSYSDITIGSAVLHDIIILPLCLYGLFIVRKKMMKNKCRQVDK